MSESTFFPTWSAHQKRWLFFGGGVAMWIGIIVGGVVTSRWHAGQPYTLELIAPGGGTYVISQRTGRIYAVELYGLALYVADISEWDDNPNLKPGTTLRTGRPWNQSSEATPMAPSAELDRIGR